MASGPETSQNAHSSAKGAGSKHGLRLRDVLRADVPAIYGALARDAAGEDRLVRRLYRFVHWLERDEARDFSTYLVTPLPLLWAGTAGDGSWSDRIHKHYLRALWRSRGLLGRAWLLIDLLLWLPIVLALTLWSSWLNAMTVRRRVAKSVTQQVIEQIWFAGRYGLLPPWYYMYELYDPAQQKKARHYIHRYELKNGLLQRLRRAIGTGRRTPTQDKLAFLKRCRTAGIQVLDNLGVYKNGRLFARNVPPEALFTQDLFVKPVRGRGGEGAGLWRHSAEGYRLQDGPLLSSTALHDHLVALSKTRTLLVQRRARNHADLVDLSNGALCTARIVTLRTEAGGHEAVTGLFRMAVGDNKQVDNFHAGGIAAPIDVASGRLGAATDWGLRPRHGWQTHHPDTGGLIEGRFLPLWAETRALAERAHGAFADRHIIGWDMAILEDGPAIVEANGGPDTDMHQRVSRDPLGDQRFGELLAFHLAKL